MAVRTLAIEGQLVSARAEETRSSRLIGAFARLLDAQAYPDNVDWGWGEGAVAHADPLEMMRLVRDRSAATSCYLLGFSDCVITGSVTARSIDRF